MAEYRTVKMEFWGDPYIESVSAETKFLYLYLITCSKTDNLGVIETTARRIAFETGMAETVISSLLAQLESDGKLVVDGQVIWLRHFIKHQTSTSPLMIKGLLKLFESIKSIKIKEAICIQYQHIAWGNDTPSIPTQYPIDTPCIPIAKDEEEREDKEEEEREDKEEELNTKTPLTPQTGGAVVVEKNPIRKHSGNSKPELEQQIRETVTDEPLQEALVAFVDMRIKNRKAMTANALTLLLAELQKLAPNDLVTQKAIVNQSIMNSWASVYPLKQDARADPQNTQQTRESRDGEALAAVRRLQQIQQGGRNATA